MNKRQAKKIETRWDARHPNHRHFAVVTAPDSDKAISSRGGEWRFRSRRQARRCAKRAVAGPFWVVASAQIFQEA